MLADGISVSVISNGIDTVDGKMLSTGELTGRTPHFTCAAGSQDWNAATTSPPCRSFSAPCTTAPHGSDLYVLISKEQKLPFCRIWKP